MFSFLSYNFWANKKAPGSLRDGVSRGLGGVVIRFQGLDFADNSDDLDNPLHP
jgi:hypothetical protein